MIDYIHIEQLELRVRIGVSEQERTGPQRIVCNITFWPQKSMDLEDKMANTVDYSGVAKSVGDLVSLSEVRLLETLSEKVATHLVTHFPIRRVTVEMRKFVLSDAAFVSAIATQEAAVG